MRDYRKTRGKTNIFITAAAAAAAVTYHWHQVPVIANISKFDFVGFHLAGKGVAGLTKTFNLFCKFPMAVLKLEV